MDNFRRNLLMDSGGGGGIGEAATPLSVVLYNKTTSDLIIVENSEWSSTAYPSTNYIPVGIVVIPGTHGVLKDGTGTVNQCGVMSLVPMDPNNPTGGGVYESGTKWGCYSIDISGKTDGLGRYDSVTDGLTNYNTVVVTSDATSNVASGLSSGGANIPRQGGAGATPDRDYRDFAPSPYNTNYMSGEYNTSYGTTEFDSSSDKNVLADFKGIVNTKILTDIHSTGQSNWKTASTITNNSGSWYAPAAACCARYKTSGTKSFAECSTKELNTGSGFWYLPSAGELGYLLPRLYDINATISKLNSAYGVGVPLDTESSYVGYWSSSERMGVSAWTVLLYYYGSMSYAGKDYGMFVRAFMRL